jgi:VIT1/CCC1 family predicted Fe2+/Mn2+ transporter
MAEIAAGCIAMGLGGYLAARSEADHFYSEVKREEFEVEAYPEKEEQEIYEIFEDYKISAEECRGVVEALKRNPKAWVDFMMRFELGLEKPNPKRALQSALNIGGAYVVGGIIPLAPYFFFDLAHDALIWSVCITLMALLVFGYFKGKLTGVSPVVSGLQTMLIGGLAAAAAFGITAVLEKLL